MNETFINFDFMTNSKPIQHFCNKFTLLPIKFALYFSKSTEKRFPEGTAKIMVPSIKIRERFFEV